MVALFRLFAFLCLLDLQHAFALQVYSLNPLNSLCKALHNCFRAMKSSEFNIEDTHLTYLDRIERLFAIMIIAFAWAYLVGIYKHLKIKPIRILKHGRKAKSIFKYGLEEIANTLLNPWYKARFDVFEILSCT